MVCILWPGSACAASNTPVLFAGGKDGSVRCGVLARWGECNMEGRGLFAEVTAGCTA